MYGNAGKTADALALEVLARYKVRPEPKLDVISLAGAMGVVRIELRDCLEEGRVERSTSGEAVVVLRRDAPRQRQRFTLAHELGHVTLQSDHAGSFTSPSHAGAFQP